MKGVTVRKKEEGKTATVPPGATAPGAKNVKSSKFKVSKDEKSGSICMDPVDKETGK